MDDFSGLDNRSSHAYLVNMRPELLPNFPQLDPAYHAPPLDDGEWTNDMEVIGATAPELQDATIKGYYHTKIHNPEQRSKVWIGGYRRMVNQQSMANFYYHGPTVDHPNLCWVRWPVPASMKSCHYPCLVCMEWLPAEAALPDVPAQHSLIFDIKTVRCGTCVAGGAGLAGQCIHGSATLQVFRNIRRAHQGEGDGSIPCTSKACRWNNPGEGEAYDRLKPIEFMPFTKVGRIRLTPG